MKDPRRKSWFVWVHEWSEQFGIAAGIITLLLIFGWIRSQNSNDNLVITTGSHVRNGLCSDGGLISWTLFRNPSRIFPFPELPTCVLNQPNLLRETMSEAHAGNGSFQYKGFGIVTLVDADGTSMTFRTIPYWFVTLPMALIAYLLLSWREFRQLRKS